MEEMRLRRVADGPRTLRSAYRRARRYEVHFSNGDRRTFTLRQLDSVLNGRAFPADFWACIGAADAAFDDDERDALIEWPSGRRADRA